MTLSSLGDRPTPVDRDPTATPPPQPRASASPSTTRQQRLDMASSASAQQKVGRGLTTTTSSPKKRKSSASASTTSVAEASAPPAKVTKRRAARACVSCRARKVRCDVVESVPCGNCRWDNVECVVQESRRRKKHIHELAATAAASARHVPATDSHGRANGSINPVSITSADSRRLSTESAVSLGGDANSGRTNGLVELGALGGLDGHVPHLLYQRAGYQDQVLLDKLRATDNDPQRLWNKLFDGDLRNSSLFSLNGIEVDVGVQLPLNIRPLPSKIAPEDVRYLRDKGALSLPPASLQNALIQSYIEYVHPYMPLLDLQDFLRVVNGADGSCGQLSLFLYQAVMFSATAFVDLKYLRGGGYQSRKAARKSFFQKTRLLYDFDYEPDRLVLVQALLLMTFWYESPDDQKDTWHWMGVAISLAHTIGLHRDPAATSMPRRKQKLWKRIWWSCFMRDRLIALGMRRPTRIKDEDFDVPMLEMADFELETLSDDNTVLPAECTLMRDIGMQEELAQLCIAKSQLCICISHMLQAQYSVLARDKMQPDATTNSTMMLLPNKKQDNIEMVKSVDLELMTWENNLDDCCRYRPLTPLDVKSGRSTIAVHRTLLHMVYQTTVSALHRPQFLPASATQGPMGPRQVQEVARLRVRDAAARITSMAADLHHLRLERYLPTTGVTVILPAMIIHLLEMKNPVQQARDRAMRGFKQCMKVMERLRETYAAADYATGFLDAALRKAAIDLNPAQTNPTQVTLPVMGGGGGKYPNPPQTVFHAQTTPPPDNAPYMTASEASMYTANFSPHDASRPSSSWFMASGGTAMDPSATSPPQTERDLDSVHEDGVTPGSHSAGSFASTSSSSSSDDNLNLDLDFMQDPSQFNWNTDVDVDQWLQFPPEGVSNTDDTFMAGVFEESSSTMTAEQALAWASASLVRDEPMGGAANVAPIQGA